MKKTVTKVDVKAAQQKLEKLLRMVSKDEMLSTSALHGHLVTFFEINYNHMLIYNWKRYGIITPEESLDFRSRMEDHYSYEQIRRAMMAAYLYSRGVSPAEIAGAVTFWAGLIDKKPSVIDKSKPKYPSYFISYSSQDEGFAKRLYSDLIDADIQCWFAPEDLKIGVKLRTGIDKSIWLNDKVLVILSEHSVASDWVEHEVEMALEKERQSGETVLFPVRLDDMVMKIAEGWPTQVRRRHIADFRNWKDYRAYKTGLDRLLRDIQATAEEVD